MDSHLTFAVPKPKVINKVLTFKGSVFSDNYFYANFNIKPEKRRKKTPKSITLIWDVSSSAINRNIDKEIDVLKGYLDWMGKGEINLITFSNTIHKRAFYQNSEVDRKRLISTLKSTQYDGGTNRSAIDFSKLKTDEILVFSDGVATFGTQESISNKTPILTINSSGIADHYYLERLARSSKGTYINVFEKSVIEAVEFATYVKKEFVRAEFDSDKIKNIYPKNGNKISGNFNLSGIIEGEKSEVILHFGFGDVITESKAFTVDNSQRLSNTLGERIWAQKRLKSLLIEDNTAAVKAHGKKFNLVTPSTSLIVLDAVSDYVQYEITPPVSLQDEYFKLLNLRNQKNRTAKEDRISQLCESFSEDIDWWKNPPKTEVKNEEIIESIAQEAPETDSDDVELADVIEFTNVSQSVSSPESRSRSSKKDD